MRGASGLPQGGSLCAREGRDELGDTPAPHPLVEKQPHGGGREAGEGRPRPQRGAGCPAPQSVEVRPRLAGWPVPGALTGRGPSEGVAGVGREVGGGRTRPWADRGRRWVDPTYRHQAAPRTHGPSRGAPPPGAGPGERGGGCGEGPLLGQAGAVLGLPTPLTSPALFLPVQGAGAGGQKVVASNHPQRALEGFFPFHQVKSRGKPARAHRGGAGRGVGGGRTPGPGPPPWAGLERGRALHLTAR